MTTLKETLANMSMFISVQVGEEFTGVYKGHREVVNTFDTDKTTVELVFELGGKDKTMTSMSLAKALENTPEGVTVNVKKLAKVGNKITWLVKEVVADASEPKVTVKEAEDALGMPIAK